MVVALVGLLVGGVAATGAKKLGIWQSTGRSWKPGPAADPEDPLVTAGEEALEVEHPALVIMAAAAASSPPTSAESRIRMPFNVRQPQPRSSP